MNTLHRTVTYYHAMPIAHGINKKHKSLWKVKRRLNERLKTVVFCLCCTSYQVLMQLQLLLPETDLYNSHRHRSHDVLRDHFVFPSPTDFYKIINIVQRQQKQHKVGQNSRFHSAVSSVWTIFVFMGLHLPVKTAWGFFLINSGNCFPTSPLSLHTLVLSLKQDTNVHFEKCFSSVCLRL